MKLNLNQEALIELKKIANKLNLSLKDLIFSDNVIILKNEASKENINKNVKEEINLISEIENWALKTKILVPDWYESKKPLHFCFILDKDWVKQAVQPTWYIWKNAKVKIFAYCFWMEYNIFHWDWKRYYLDEWASLEIYEFNYNSNSSYLEVANTFYVELKDNAYFENYYVSIVWKLWKNLTRWFIKCLWKNSKAVFTTKNKILKDDISDLDIKVELIWENSSAIISSKSITYEWWTNDFKATLIWKWDFCKWHIECDEISIWKWIIKTTPKLEVENPTARLTHEASIWSLEKNAIDNLLIKWLTFDQAINFMISWILW